MDLGSFILEESKIKEFSAKVECRLKNADNSPIIWKFRPISPTMFYIIKRDYEAEEFTEYDRLCAVIAASVIYPNFNGSELQKTLNCTGAGVKDCIEALQLSVGVINDIVELIYEKSNLVSTECEVEEIKNA